MPHLERGQTLDDDFIAVQDALCPLYGALNTIRNLSCINQDSAMTKEVEKIYGGALDTFVDGKDPKTDAATGAGIAVVGLIGVAVVAASAVTLPILGLAAALGAVGGWATGADKRNKSRKG